MNGTAEVLLKVENLKTYFFTDEGIVKALDGVSFEIPKLKDGSTLGMVGESGCGKSVTARSILGILGPRGKIVEGRILFCPDGKTIDLSKLDPKGKQIREIRGRDISMVFQEPMASFSPVYTIGEQVMEAILMHQAVGKKEARQRVISMLRKVGIPKAEKMLDSYPFEFSGGMRQRAMIATALSCHPKLLIADEPTTALDVTIQAQILDLLRTLQADQGMAIMLITHNMGVIAEMADEIIVMYLGKIMERAPVERLFSDPKHPYTAALLKSIPKVGQKTDKLEIITGDVPDVQHIPSGCRFHTRCVFFMEGQCNISEPAEVEIAPGHTVRCFRYGGTEGKSDV